MNDAALQEGPGGEAGTLETPRIVIPYKPRAHFVPFHASEKRFRFVVAHRRAGKSVSEINETIKKALQNTRQYPPPRYGYVGPSFAQTKDLIWGYLKHYTAPLSKLPGYSVSEGDLTVTLPNGATIALYGGAAAYERMRGLYFDGIVLDEFPLLNPSVFSTVVRPCLADYRGWAVISGTSNGDDHFHELKKKNENDPAWDFFIIPVTETDALHPDEVIEMTKDMSPAEYAREMLCRFDAPIEGSYYADLINDMALGGKITGVPHDPAASVFTWWDLGVDDQTSIWFIQFAGREIHVIDYYANSGKGLDHYAAAIKGSEPGSEHRQKYVYGGHVTPHDIKVREIGNQARTRYEVLSNLLSDPILVCENHRIEDGIQAVRSILPLCWFDAVKTNDGLSGLRNYHRTKAGKPKHNWASHPADAFRIGAASINFIKAFSSSGNITALSGRLRRRVRGII